MSDFRCTGFRVLELVCVFMSKRDDCIPILTTHHRPLLCEPLASLTAADWHTLDSTAVEYMYFIYNSYMFCLHLYKNTECSRVSPQHISQEIITFFFCFSLFGTQTDFLPGAIQNLPVKYNVCGHCSSEALFRMQMTSLCSCLSETWSVLSEI